MRNQSTWETLGCHKDGKPGATNQRIKVTGGWVVMCKGGFLGLTFIADPEHQWDGYSLNNLPW